MGPLTTFYDGVVEDSEDREKLALAWQDSAGLRDSLSMMVEALASDEQAQTLARRGGAEELRNEVAALLGQVGVAAEAGQRVRLLYAL